MKRLAMALCVLLAVMTIVSSAVAEEVWDYHLRGSDEGLASGALPPPGAYFINDFFWSGNWKGYDNLGNPTGTKSNGYVDIPILLWNPGICPILGATYACAMAQPFLGTTLRSSGAGPGESGTQWGVYNTVLTPIILSWRIPCNFYVSTAFAIGFNDGTTSPADSLATVPGTPAYHFYQARFSGKDNGNIYAWSSNGSYEFTPQFGLSWLYAGWNLSAEFQYTFYTKDSDIDYQSGDELAMDYTATYTWERWTFGAGAEIERQTYNDKGFNGLTYGTLPGSCAENIGVGPILGYNFGPCSLLFSYNFSVVTKSDSGGDWFLMRLVVPLGNPTDWWK